MVKREITNYEAWQAEGNAYAPPKGMNPEPPRRSGPSWPAVVLRITGGVMILCALFMCLMGSLLSLFLLLMGAAMIVATFPQLDLFKSDRRLRREMKERYGGQTTQPTQSPEEFFQDLEKKI